MMQETITASNVPLSGSIEAYALTTDALLVDLRGAYRVLIRVDGDDIRIAYSDWEVDNGTYFTVADGTNAIYDPGAGFTAGSMFGDAVFIRADSGTCTLNVWKMGTSYGRS